MIQWGMKSGKCTVGTSRLHISYCKEIIARKKCNMSGRNLYINISDILTNPMYGPGFDLNSNTQNVKNHSTVWKM